MTRKKPEPITEQRMRCHFCGGGNYDPPCARCKGTGRLDRPHAAPDTAAADKALADYMVGLDGESYLFDAPMCQLVNACRAARGAK